MAVSYETKILILTFAVSVLLAATYLYFQDLLYIKVTGRPASERERDRIERRNRPLTRNSYLGWSLLFWSAFLGGAYLAGWSGVYRGWGRLIPIGWMISGGVPFYLLHKRWRKQQADLSDQVSGGER